MSLISEWSLQPRTHFFLFSVEQLFFLELDQKEQRCKLKPGMEVWYSLLYHTPITEPSAQLKYWLQACNRQNQGCSGNSCSQCYSHCQIFTDFLIFHTPSEMFISIQIVITSPVILPLGSLFHSTLFILSSGHLKINTYINFPEKHAFVSSENKSLQKVAFKNVTLCRPMLMQNTTFNSQTSIHPFRVFRHKNDAIFIFSLLLKRCKIRKKLEHDWGFLLERNSHKTKKKRTFTSFTKMIPGN